MTLLNRLQSLGVTLALVAGVGLTVPSPTVLAAQKTTTSTKKAKVAPKRASQPKSKNARAVNKRNVKTAKNGKGGRRALGSRVGSNRRLPSVATLAGLYKSPDLLGLSSSVAYAVDQDTGEVLFDKNGTVPLPMASLTKLMTGLTLFEEKPGWEEKIKITRADYTIDKARSKIRQGMILTRHDLLKAALMSSDNHAAHALARTSPSGKAAFIEHMNEVADRLGMDNSEFYDPTGLDNRNRTTAQDLTKLVSEVDNHAILREASTLAFATLPAGRWRVSLHTTNRLIGDPTWDIGVQKTGYTRAAGRCMVVQTQIGERRVVLVTMDSPNSTKRAQDMRMLRNYIVQRDQFAPTFAQMTPYEIF